jgi:hypothetical protein
MTAVLRAPALALPARRATLVRPRAVTRVATTTAGTPASIQSRGHRLHGQKVTSSAEVPAVVAATAAPDGVSTTHDAARLLAAFPVLALLAAPEAAEAAVNPVNGARIR